MAYASDDSSWLPHTEASPGDLERVAEQAERDLEQLARALRQAERELAELRRGSVPADRCDRCGG